MLGAKAIEDPRDYKLIDSDIHWLEMPYATLGLFVMVAVIGTVHLQAIKINDGKLAHRVYYTCHCYCNTRHDHGIVIQPYI